MKKYLWLLSVVTILGCDNRFIDPFSGASPSQNLSTDLDEQFILPIGETAVFENEGLIIRFESVPTESRCPEGALCIWEGEGIVKLQIAKSGMGTTTIELNTTQPRMAELFSYTVELLELTPHPVLDQQLDASAYRASLIVKKVNDQ
ncbi:hypothetical protein JNL27_04205 [bacterium]|nr:hypothetical protein [bacterium]